MEIRNSKKFGKNFVLDFTDTSGEPSKTVVLAGENGSGKTNILLSIRDLHTLKLDDAAANEFRQFRVRLSEKEKMALIRSGVLLGRKDYFASLFNKNNSVVFISLYSDGRAAVTKAAENLPQNIVPFSRDQDAMETFWLSLSTIYSEGAVGLNGSLIKDDGVSFFNKTGNRLLSTSIRENIIDLLINLRSQDYKMIAREFCKRTENGESLEGLYNSQAIERFKKAFNNFFVNKQLSDIDLENKKVLFKHDESSEYFDINDLSSGEKQIVFRGVAMLHSQENNFDSIFLLDEPETSLHPRWQQKILDFYKDLLKDGDGRQRSQIFVATHSPYVLQNAKDTCLYILTRKNDGSIKAEKKNKAYGWTPDQLTSEAFGVSIRPDIINDELKELNEILSSIRGNEHSSVELERLIELTNVLTAKLDEHDYALVGIEIARTLHALREKYAQN